MAIVAQATITSGTGRFAEASGTFTLAWTFNPATGQTSGAFDGAVQLR